MSLDKTRRFWKTAAAVAAPNGSGFTVALDGRPIRAPLSRRPLTLPTAALAEAVAAEWQAQGETVAPETMPLTRLANTWQDKVAPGREALAAELLRHVEADCLCYFAAGPADLVERQRAAWLPVLDWAAARFGARWETTAGILPLTQPPAVHAAAAAALAGLDDPAFTAVQAAAPVCGSLLLALALAAGRITAAQAHAAALVDELFQAECWGADDEAIARRKALHADLEDTARFLALARG